MSNEFFETKPEVIKSVQYSDQDIINSIRKLYLDGKNFDLDPCFSSGKFYKGINEPKIKLDKTPQREDVKENDILNGLPCESNSLNGIIFDPPFMFGKHGKTDENKMTKRFTMFSSWEELKNMYCTALYHFYRVLRKNGIVAFKCQDYTDSKTTLTHCYVHNWAIDTGFKVEDIFINL